MLNLSALMSPRLHHFGLSIGRSSLRAVEVDRQGKIRISYEIAIPDGIFSGGILTKKDELINLLKTLISQSKITTPYVSVCFSEVYAFTREQTLPVISQADLNEALSWNISDLIPFPKEDIYYDWKLVDQTDSEYKVMIVAVAKKILDPLLEALNDAGLKPLRFEPGTSAIARLLTMKQGESVVVTEINRKGAYVVLIQEKKVLFTTVVNFTSEDTNESYFTNIAQTITEVSAYYKEKGFLQETATYILFTGEMASQEWTNVLSLRLKYPVKILQMPQISPAFNKAYVTATGSIAVPQDQLTINLLPPPIQKRFDDERLHAFYTALLTRFSAVLFMIVVSCVGSFIAVTLEQQRLETNVVSLTQSTKNQGGQIQQLLSLNANAHHVVTLAPLRKTPQDAFRVIESVLPTGIVITQWEYDDAKLQFTLQGVAGAREQLLLFKNKLEQTGEFTKVALPLGSLETPQNVRFSVSFISK